MSQPHVKRLAGRQSGSVLIVSLVLLVVLTLIVISIIKASNVNSKIAGNMQVQKEAEASAQQAIEWVISQPFQDAPTAVVTAAMPIDINHDGTTDYHVNIPAPTCTNVTPIKLSDLDAANSDDVPCYTSSAYVPGMPSGNSLCSNSQWDIQATATDPNGSAATVTTHQGIAVRVAAGTTCP